MPRKRRLSDGDGGGGHDGGGSLRWLLTYADMITLLMAFFIMLYSMSILNLNRFKSVAVSIRSGFNGPLKGQSKTILTGDKPEVIKNVALPDDDKVTEDLAKKIQALVKSQKLENLVKMRTDERGLVVSISTDKLVFQKGQADLSPTAKKILSTIAKVLKEIPNQIRVEGHTCDLPTRSVKYPSNWELSTARATMVIRFLVEQAHIPPVRLSAAGYADSKPLVKNTSEKNRAMNRRVDMVILRAGYKDNQR